MPGIQEQAVVNVMNRLRLTDLSVDAGQIDPSILSAVYGPKPEWIRLVPTLTRDVTAINGVTINDDDVDATVISGQGPVLSDNRMWQFVQIMLSGGTVSPIIVSLTINVGGDGIEIWRDDMVNPSRLMLGPFLIPAGSTHRVATGTNGGVGDQIHVTRFGFQSPIGIGFPIVPGPFSETY